MRRKVIVLVLGIQIAHGLAARAVPAQVPVSPAQAEQIAGPWLGALALEVPFRILLTLRYGGTTLSGSMDFPDQNARGLPLSELRLERDSLHVRLAPAAVSFAGRVAPSGDSIVGVFAQGAQRFPLTLRRPTAEQMQELDRPQEPALPYPYREERVRISADSGIVLAGTLTLPTEPGPHPAVLLLSGSGPLDRDASVAGHRPFLVLADLLTRRGFAALRYAKRGAPPSSGNFAPATTAEFARDAEAAVRYLRGRSEVDDARIALLGHSEGALVAAMVAGQDRRLAGAVFIGAPGLRGDSLMVSRASALLADRGLPDSLVRKDATLRAAVLHSIIAPGDKAATRTRTQAVVESELQRFATSELEALGYSRESWNEGVEVYLAQHAWFRYWLTLDPLPLYRRMPGPVLALYGGIDRQVPPASNAAPVRLALGARGGNSVVEVLPGVNHQMQPAKTGSPAEYGRIAETISPAVIHRIAGWLTALLQPGR